MVLKTIAMIFKIIAVVLKIMGIVFKIIAVVLKIMGIVFKIIAVVSKTMTLIIQQQKNFGSLSDFRSFSFQGSRQAGSESLCPDGFWVLPFSS